MVYDNFNSIVNTMTVALCNIKLLLIPLSCMYMCIIISIMIIIVTIIINYYYMLQLLLCMCVVSILNYSQSLIQIIELYVYDNAIH